MCSARRSTVAVVIAISRDLILISTLSLSLYYWHPHQLSHYDQITQQNLFLFVT